MRYKPGCDSQRGSDARILETVYQSWPALGAGTRIAGRTGKHDG